MKILIVEDDSDSLKLISTILSLHNYQTLAATSVKEAISHLQSHSAIELVICDVMMPEQDGFDFLRYIKENLRFNHIPVIMSTVLNDRESVIKSLRLGAKDYIVKPITDETLSLKVKSVLEKGSGTALVVIEDKLILDLLVASIERENYKIIAAQSAETALELLKSKKADLVITDIILPHMNGFDLLIEVKDLYPHIPVILIIDNSGKFKEKHAVEAGADGCITRPFRNIQITRLLKSLSSGQRMNSID